MPAKPFEATVRQRPGAAVLVLRGDVGGSAQRALYAAYDEAESTNPDVILLNFPDEASALTGATKR
jgi:hypothetical protein